MENNKEPTTENSDYTKKMKVFFEWLRKKQDWDMVALDVKHINSVTEGVLIASAVNARHARALADWVLEMMAKSGQEFLGMEGYSRGGWILIDCNDFVLNIFQEDERKFYNLEGLWSDAPLIPMPEEETGNGQQ